MTHVQDVETPVGQHHGSHGPPDTPTSPLYAHFPGVFRGAPAWRPGCRGAPLPEGNFPAAVPGRHPVMTFGA
ncbi:hypothetical protein GCM10009681_18120 [Luedemannella helvata]|uniref:Uncharacterized protein n=1 Tax=Luedemannella helvata TaxID=349315 RepID=A0ABP4W4W6_9ACTN